MNGSMESQATMRDYRGYILDLDGVVYRGDLVLPGARELTEWVDATRRRLVFLSNNSVATPQEVAAKLARLGIPRPEDRTLTAGLAAVQDIARRHAGARVLVLALPSIERLAREHGLAVVSADAPPAADGPLPEVVLAGLDRTLTYARLKHAMQAVLAGAEIVAVNRDPRLPVEGTFEPGTGSIVAALEYASGQRARMIGKPAPEIVHEAVRQLDVALDDVLMVGDGLDLDIPAGRAAGVATALVLTGLTTAAQLGTAVAATRPDLVFDGLSQLLRAAQAAASGG